MIRPATVIVVVVCTAGGCWLGYIYLGWAGAVLGLSLGAVVGWLVHLGRTYLAQLLGRQQRKGLIIVFGPGSGFDKAALASGMRKEFGDRAICLVVQSSAAIPQHIGMTASNKSYQPSNFFFYHSIPVAVKTGDVQTSTGTLWGKHFVSSVLTAIEDHADRFRDIKFLHDAENNTGQLYLSLAELTAEECSVIGRRIEDTYVAATARFINHLLTSVQ